MIRAVARITPPWVGIDVISSAERAGHHVLASLPRPKQTAACCGLGNAAIDWKTPLSTAFVCYPITQGGAARLRRTALPWAKLFHAFGVRNFETAQHQNAQAKDPYRFAVLLSLRASMGAARGDEAIESCALVNAPNKNFTERRSAWCLRVGGIAIG